MRLQIIHRTSGYILLARALMFTGPALALSVAHAQDGNPVSPSTQAGADPQAAPEQAAETTSEVIPLGRVEVRGKRNLFDEQAARRRKLLDESAPCLGCDAKPIEHQRKLLERVADYALDQVTPQAAPEKDEAGNLDHQRQVEEAHPTNSNP